MFWQICNVLRPVRWALPGLALCMFFSAHAFGQIAKCLPAGVGLTTIVRYVEQKNGVEKTLANVVTVGDELKTVGGRCKNGTLKSKAGRPIRFYNLQGCWGNPPANYLEIIDEQKKEIERLKRTFTLIELTCDQDARPRY